MGRAVKNSLEISIEQVRLEGGFERAGRMRVAECLRQTVPDRWASIISIYQAFYRSMFSCPSVQSSRSVHPVFLLFSHQSIPLFDQVVNWLIVTHLAYDDF